MRVAITGASGAIGRALMNECLSAGWGVNALTRDKGKISESQTRLKIVEGDLTGEDSVLDELLEHVNVLVHCAAETKDESRMDVINVEGTRKLVHSASGKIERFVFLSSVGVYGSPGSGLFDESSDNNPRNKYEISKVEAEEVVKENADNGEYNYTILRPAKVMGVKSIDSDLMNLIDVINKGSFFFIGKPGASANYVHLHDLIHALMRVIEDKGKHNKIYNLCEWHSLEEFVDIIDRELGNNKKHTRLPAMPVRLAARILGVIPGFPLNIRRVNGLTTRARFSSKKLKEELGYKAVYGVERGLASLVKNWRRNQAKAFKLD